MATPKEGAPPSAGRARRSTRVRVSQFAVVPAAAVLDRSLTPAQKTVMQVVCLHANRDGWCWALFETMAEEVGVAVPQISKMVAALVAAGYLERHHRTMKGRRRVMLRVLYDRPASTIEDVDPADIAEEPVSVVETLDENATFQGGKSAADDFPPRKPRVSTLESHILIEQTKEQKLPSTAAREGEAENESGDLSSCYVHEAHRDAYHALRAKHPRPAMLDASLRAVHQPITGGPGYAWEVIGAALLDQLGNGETFNLARLRGYCRQAATPRTNARPAAASPAASAGVPIGGRTWSGPALWELFVRGGFTAPMQTRETLAERAQVLARDGQIPDADAFLALVLHVKPWALAEIKFAKSREERLLELLATFHAPAQGAA